VPESDKNDETTVSKCTEIVVEPELDMKDVDLVQVFDGFVLYKRKKCSQVMVKRYCYMLDQDFMQHKVTLCAYSNSLMLYC